MDQSMGPKGVWFSVLESGGGVAPHFPIRLLRIAIRPVVMLALLALPFTPSIASAQTDQPVDVFPLAVGNQWTYFYTLLHDSWPGIGRDTGLVTYQIIGKITTPDSVRWICEYRRDVDVLFLLFPYVDTTYHICDTSLIELVELLAGQHRIYVQGDPVVSQPFSFSREYDDTASVLRFSVVGPGDTMAIEFLPWEHEFVSYTFKKDVGLIRNFNSGGEGDYRWGYDHSLVDTVIVSVGNRAGSGFPSTFELLQNYPNPFNPNTTIEYSLPHGGHIALRIYNVLGEAVATLVDGEQTAGTFKATWIASGFASGVYFYRLTAGAFVETRKMLMIK